MKRKGQVKFVQKDKSQFFSILKERVDGYFVDNNISKYADAKYQGTMSPGGSAEYRREAQWNRQDHAFPLSMQRSAPASRIAL